MGQRRVTFCFHVKWNFRWNWRNVVADQSNPQSFAQSFDQSLVSELKYDIKTKQDVLHRILCKAADLNWRPVQEKGVCSDFYQTAQLLQMVGCKSLEMMCDMMLYQQQPKFAAKSFANEMLCLKAMLWPALKGRASIFELKNFSAICPCTVLLTDHLLLDLEDLS